MSQMSNPSTSVDESYTRKKVWAPKRKTGCLTCRRRRIKCDEIKPVCGRCESTWRECSYLHSEGVMIQASESTVASVPTREVGPDLWHIFEAVAYLNNVINPCYAEKMLMGSAQQQGKVLVQPMRPTNDGLIAGTLLYRIWATTRLHGCDLAPSKVHGTWSLWARLTDRLQNLLMLANRDIQIEAKTQDVLTCVYGMVLIEGALELSAWRQHLEGFMALLHVRGGPGLLLQSKVVTWNTVQGAMIYCVLGNTFARPQNQMKGIYSFDTQDIKMVYGKTHFPPFPCPTELFMELMAILRLRIVALWSKVSVEEMQSDFQGIIARIDAFDADNWKETYPMPPDRSEIPIVAKIFKISVKLFGLLCLPPSMYDSSRIIETRQQLLSAMRLVSSSARCDLVLLWPAAVAGTALARTPGIDQKYIQDYLEQRSQERYAFGGPRKIKGRLVSFWESGRLGWDNCWDEPFHMSV